MVIQIPHEKLIRLKSLLEPLLWKRLIKEFESIVGLMAFCSKALASSRAFLRTFYDVLASVKSRNPIFSIKITCEIRENIKVWLDFLQKCNGVCYITGNDWISNDSLQLFSDSADLGCAAFLAGKWIQYQWPKHWKNQPITRDITFLELVPIVLGLFVWGLALSNTKILFRIDNLALVNIVNKRTSKSKRIMSLVRPIVLYTMRYGIQFKTKHIEGTNNQIAFPFSGRFCSGRGGRTRGNTKPVYQVDIKHEIDRLIDNSISINTRRMYQMSLDTFVNFRESMSLCDMWPIPLDHITHFIAYLSLNGFSPSTVKS
jgi:hypothetical protein